MYASDFSQSVKKWYDRYVHESAWPSCTVYTYCTCSCHIMLSTNTLIFRYRWIHSPSSLLYEPAICRMIHKLMKKMFLQLIGEFRRLGSTIIYADFSKIVVCTKKKRMSDACAYIQYILDSIGSRELFHTLSIEPSRCWTYLWWMDQANYGGTSVAIPESMMMMSEEQGDAVDERSEVMEVEEDKGESSEEVEMKWNIRQYLPQAGSCQELFNVSQFVDVFSVKLTMISFAYV